MQAGNQEGDGASQPADWRDESTTSITTIDSTTTTSPEASAAAGGTHTVTSLIKTCVRMEASTFALQFGVLLGAPRRSGHGGGSSSALPPKGMAAVTSEALQGQGSCPSCTINRSASMDCQCHSDQQLSRRTMLDRLMGKLDTFLERSCVKGFLSVPYMSRLLFSFAFFWTCAYLNAVATMFSSRRNPQIRVLDAHTGAPLDSHTLPDLGHELWSWALTAVGYGADYIDEHSLPDRWVSALGNLTLLLMVAHPRRLLILRRVAMTFGALLLMRAVAVSATVLPDASPVCAAQFGDPAARAYKSEPAFPGVLLRALTFMVEPTSMVTCGDMMFSGHTTVLMMSAQVWATYFRAEHLATRALFAAPLTEALLTPLRRAVYAYCALGCAVIIGSRLHYTNDVLAAVFLSITVFTAYHAAARDVAGGDADARARAPRLVRWLEAESVRSLDDGAYARAAAARCD